MPKGSVRDKNGHDAWIFPDGSHVPLAVGIDTSGNVIANPVRKDMEGGGKVAVGTTAVEVTFTGTPTAIIISADIFNNGILYVGESNVDSNGNNSITFLQSGENVSIPYNDDTNPVYVVASIANQNYFEGALL